MKLIEGIINFFNIETQEPAPYGGLHLSFLFLVIFISILLVSKRDSSDAAFRIIIGVISVVMITFEGAKQVSTSMTVSEGAILFSYDWSSFPFQLCSTPLYVLPVLALLPDGRARDVAAAYTMTFGFIGGVAVYLVPQTIFTAFPAVNIQSLIHHGLQIVSGVYTAAYYRRRISGSFFLGGQVLFTVMITVANLLNTVVYDALVSHGFMEEGDGFNMFYISPRADQTPPIFEEFFKSIPPALFIVGYYLLLTAGAVVIMSAVRKAYESSRVHRGLEAIHICRKA